MSLSHSFSEPLVLASQSPRRRQLLAEAGYEFSVDAPPDSVECGACSSQPPAELVLESAFLKAKYIASRYDAAVVLAADTVAECHGQILGKPVDVDHAERMLRLMSGQRHAVLTGMAVWHRPANEFVSQVEITVLRMDELGDEMLQGFLDSDQWVGKAGAFGYQDGLDWVHIEKGLASNVVGLPVEKLPVLFQDLKQKIDLAS